MSPPFIHNPLRGRYSIIPTEVRNYLGTATSDQLKALIFLLTSGDDAPPSDADFRSLSMTRGEFNEAIAFWQKNGLLDLGQKSAPIVALPRPKTLKLDETPVYNPLQIATDMDQNDALRHMILTAQTILGKTLNSSEVSTIYSLYDWLRLPVEVVLMLLEHCAAQNKRGLKYIEKTAIEWSKAGVSTIDEADRYIKELRGDDEFCAHIATLFNLNGELSPNERRYAARWHRMGLDDETLLLACEKTKERTGKVAFAYMNTILEGWQRDGAPTKAPAPRRAANRPAASASGRLDYDEFERMSLEYMLKQPKGE